MKERFNMIANDNEVSYRDLIYDHYQTTTYGHRTNLSIEGVENNAAQHNQFFRQFLPHEKNASILDIGCGNGGFLLACQQLGYRHIKGIDTSAEQVEYCHQLGFEQVVCTDALSYLRHCDEKFALIAMIDVIEHLKKDEVFATLLLIRKHLEPGGTIILRVPNMSNPLNIRTRYVDLTHETGFSKESMAQALRVTGFDVETIHGAFFKHPRWIMRLVFDQILWRAFVMFCQRTMHLPAEIIPGKNLIAVAKRPIT